MDSNKNVIKQLWAGLVTIESATQKEASSYKGKSFPAKIEVEFKSEDGRYIAGKFRLPFTEEKHKYDKKNWDNLLKAAGVKKPSELVGKQVGLVVAPYEWEEKVLWNPHGYYDKKYLLNPIDAALGSLDNLTGDSTDTIEW